MSQKESKLSWGWTLLLERFKVTILLSALILIGGIAAYVFIPREVTPTIEIPAATISTYWPGASPTDMEKLVTDKIEKEIKNLENLEKYTSISQSGVSIISIEFEVGTNNDTNIQRLREKIDIVEKDLPETVLNEPTIREVSISDVPIVSLMVSGDYAWSELKQFSEILEDDLTGIPKVKDVSVKGAPEDKVHIFLDPVKLEANDVAVNDVLQAIRAAHRDTPLGEIFIETQKVEVTVRSELEHADDFLNVPLRTQNGRLIHVRDIATVRREFDTFEVETYFSKGNGTRPAVLIDVIKSASKGNVIAMVAEVVSRVEDLKTKGLLPEELQVDVTFDRGALIQESLDVLTGSGLQTLILIGLVMLLALGWRESILASISIPLSMLIGITVLYISGRTFNGISLFALVISIGLLVDNAIIVVEGISSGIFEKKQSPREAAIDTIRIFRWPIITGTLTTVFAFLPMLYFISGVSGQYISVLPITVITILIAALFVTLLILPSFGMYFFQIFKPKAEKKSRVLTACQNWYEKNMTWILETRLRSWAVLGIAFLSLAAAAGLVAGKKVLIEIFPASDQTFFAAKIELPVGTSLQETRLLVAPLKKSIDPFFAPQGENGEIWFKNVVFTVGKRSDAVTDFDDVGGLPEEHVLGLTFNLTDKEDRQTKSYTILPLIQKAVEEALPAHAELRFSEVQEGPPTGSPIEIRLAGSDMAHLEVLADEVSVYLEDQPETRNVRDSRSDRTLQVVWRFDRDMLAQFGLTPTMISESLRSAVNGITVVQLVEGDEEIDVDIRIDWEGDQVWDDPTSLDHLERIPLRTPSGAYVTLRQIATPELTSELSVLEHRDGKRVLVVRSDLEKGVPASKLTPRLKNLIKGLETHPGESIEMGGENEEGLRLMREMTASMLFALLLILVALVWQFNSFWEATVILLIIPLSLTGVILGFFLLGLPISFPTMIGIVSLAGIIVNDAIVLIDQINHNARKHGLDRIKAFIRAGKERMQPIALTSITTVVGLLPLSLSDEVWAGLGFAIIFGMMLSTVLTLLLVPCFLRIAHK